MYNFQNAASMSMEELLFFHDMLLVLVVSIMSFILLMMVARNAFSNRLMTESHGIEFLWTLGPVIILTAFVLPSLQLLYFLEGEATINVKVLGHQWYWQYEYDEAYNSYLISDYRLYSTDNRLSLPNKVAQLLITAGDVLHSWAVPTLAAKADAVPGRLNSLLLCPKRPGVYYGQCSEICGSNHSFMPISMECYFNLSLFWK